MNATITKPIAIPTSPAAGVDPLLSHRRTNVHSPELTVIVTCFNVAEFVPACLRSIFHQPDADRLRILVIDDGSVDNTFEVVQAQIAAHPNVDCELISQSNQGISGARNTGLRLARTSYVTFVDGDDFWAANHLELVMPVINEGHADIIAFNASIVDIDGRRLDSLHLHTLFSREARFSCSELACDAATVGGWHPWARIFKTRLLDGVCFPAGRYYEDVAVLPSLYARASHIETLKEELYVYRHRPGSITSSITDKHIDDLLLCVREATARITDGSTYWKTVRRNVILHVAAEIGRAPRVLRHSMFSRAWPDVQAHSDLSFRLNWILTMLDVCLRSEVKGLLGLPRSRVYSTPSSALK
jgi:glycosyltransferase involved in cell wall biosynthesis